MVLVTSNPATYANTHGNESSTDTPFLQPQTPVGAVMPVPPHRADTDEQRPVYADVFTAQPPSEEVNAPPVVDRKEEYAEVVGFKNPEVKLFSSWS